MVNVPLLRFVRSELERTARDSATKNQSGEAQLFLEMLYYAQNKGGGSLYWEQAFLLFSLDVIDRRRGNSHGFSPYPRATKDRFSRIAERPDAIENGALTLLARGMTPAVFASSLKQAVEADTPDDSLGTLGLLVLDIAHDRVPEVDLGSGFKSLVSAGREELLYLFSESSR